MLCALMHLLHGSHGAHGESGEHGAGAHEHAGADPQQILLARYARGEITEEQLTHMQRVLTEARGATRANG